MNSRDVFPATKFEGRKLTRAVSRYEMLRGMKNLGSGSLSGGPNVDSPESVRRSPVNDV